MTAPRTAVHASGPRRRTPTGRRRSAGTPRRSTGRSTGRRRPAAPRGRRRGPARRRTRSGLARWWPAVLVATAVLVGLAWGAEKTSIPLVTGECRLPTSSVTLSVEQARNAATIAAVARDRGLPERAVVIALATAQQESRLRNLDYGDRDSLGLFQQRPSKGWGSPAQVQDPVYAAGIFYDRLVQVPGWETGRLTEVAQAIQRSGFPEAYQQWEPMATELAAMLLADPSGAFSCD